MRAIAVTFMLGAAAVAALGQTSTANAVEIVPVRGHIYMLAGAGGNITVSIGPDGVLLVDSGLQKMSDRCSRPFRN